MSGFVKLQSVIKNTFEHFEKWFCRKVASSNTSRLEAHAGFFRLLVKGVFDPYVQ